MNLPDAPVPREGFFVTHFITVEDQDNYIIEVGQASQTMIDLFEKLTK
jgi:hypothetical protein